MQLGDVGDGLGKLSGKAEVSGSRGGPALPGFALVGAVEAGVDFDAGEPVGVTLEVSEVVGTWRREVVGVRFGEGPTGGADVDVELGRHRADRFHKDLARRRF